MESIFQLTQGCMDWCREQISDSVVEKNSVIYIGFILLAAYIFMKSSGFLEERLDCRHYWMITAIPEILVLTALISLVYLIRFQ